MGDPANMREIRVMVPAEQADKILAHLKAGNRIGFKPGENMRGGAMARADDGTLGQLIDYLHRAARDTRDLQVRHALALACIALGGKPTGAEPPPETGIEKRFPTEFGIAIRRGGVITVTYPGGGIVNDDAPKDGAS